MTKNRHIALFPGAFRPPHQAHYAAVLDLVSRPDIDEVVVVIANRSRHLPGTTRALDAEVARRLLEIYLQDIPKVRLEIAYHDAISHALEYLDKAEPGDTLLFCIGEADFERGDDRFEKLVSQREHDKISVTVVPAPTASLPIRATTLREALAIGEAKRTEFIAGLPPHLSAEQSERVWSICRNGLRPVSDITAEKLRTILAAKLSAYISALTPVVSNKLEPVFRAELDNGKNLFVKYAGDTTEAGSLGQALKPKPRRRLGAERRALKYLRSLSLENVELAEMVLFDKETLTLVLSEVCPAGISLQEQLQTGVFDPQIAAAASRFLAACHTVNNIPALWGEPETDLQHWQAMLALRTATDSSLLSPAMREDLRRLRRSSGQALEHRFFHLDYCPKNIRIGENNCGQNKIGVIDFELCSSVGDPAYDLGTFLGHYLLWGICSGPTHSCQVALHEAMAAYRQKVGGSWSKMNSCVVAFAGACILFNLERDYRFHGLEQPLLNTAASLLAQSIDYSDEAEQRLCAALAKS